MEYNTKVCRKCKKFFDKKHHLDICCQRCRKYLLEDKSWRRYSTYDKYINQCWACGFPYYSSNKEAITCAGCRKEIVKDIWQEVEKKYIKKNKIDKNNNWKCQGCGKEKYIYYYDQPSKCGACLKNMQDIRTFFKVKNKDKK